MRLLEISTILELGERGADRRRRHTQPGPMREASRSDRFGRVDVLSDKRRENLRGSRR
jgi:hypothetical protein